LLPTAPKGTGDGDEVELGEGENEIGMGRSVDWEKRSCFFADVLADFGKTRLGWKEVWIGMGRSVDWEEVWIGEQLYIGEELFLFCICLYGSFLYLDLGEERKYDFITVLCKVLLGRLISVK